MKSKFINAKYSCLSLSLKRTIPGQEWRAGKSHPGQICSNSLRLYRLRFSGQ